MRSVSLAFGILAVTTVVTQAQTQRPASLNHTYAEGSAVAHGQPLYYIQRLGPSRYYPPTRYGYVEVMGRAPVSGGAMRTGR